METQHKHLIVVAGDVGTYKAALCQSLKKALSSTGIPCSITMQDEAVGNAFNVFVTTSKSELHSDVNKKSLTHFDVVLDIDTMTEEEATEHTIEQFAKWCN